MENTHHKLVIRSCFHSCPYKNSLSLDIFSKLEASNTDNDRLIKYIWYYIMIYKSSTSWFVLEISPWINYYGPYKLFLDLSSWSQQGQQGPYCITWVSFYIKLKRLLMQGHILLWQSRHDTYWLVWPLHSKSAPEPLHQVLKSSVPSITIFWHILNICWHILFSLIPLQYCMSQTLQKNYICYNSNYESNTPINLFNSLDFGTTNFSEDKKNEFQV